jgi:hypothetical protein
VLAQVDGSPYLNELRLRLDFVTTVPLGFAVEPADLLSQSSLPLPLKVLLDKAFRHLLGSLSKRFPLVFHGAQRRKAFFELRQNAMLAAQALASALGACEDDLTSSLSLKVMKVSTALSVLAS